jgi:hypothetical protein
MPGGNPVCRVAAVSPAVSVTALLALAVMLVAGSMPNAWCADHLLLSGLAPIFPSPEGDPGSAPPFQYGSEPYGYQPQVRDRPTVVPSLCQVALIPSDEEEPARGLACRPQRCGTTLECCLGDVRRLGQVQRGSCGNAPRVVRGRASVYPKGLVSCHNV